MYATKNNINEFNRQHDQESSVKRFQDAEYLKAEARLKAVRMTTAILRYRRRVLHHFNMDLQGVDTEDILDTETYLELRRGVANGVGTRHEECVWFTGEFRFGIAVPTESQLQMVPEDEEYPLLT